MNVKNKVVSVVMSFVIIFGTVSNSFANDKERINNLQPLVSSSGAVTSPMVGTIATLAVASGIALNTYDDLYDIVAMFNSVNSNLDVVKEIFDRDVKILGNKLVSVGNDFLNLCKNAFDVYFADVAPSKIGGVLGLDNILNHKILNISNVTTGSIDSGKLTFDYKFSTDLTTFHFDIYVNGVRKSSGSINSSYFSSKLKTYEGRNIYFKVLGSKLCSFVEGYKTRMDILSLSAFYDYAIDYAGGYDFDNINSRLEEDNSISVGVPGNLGSLVGGNVDVFSPSYPLTEGGVSLPLVDSPTVDVVEDVFVSSPSTDSPGVDVPGTGNPGIVFPPFGGGLDFTPITQSSFVDKFPFSLAKDIKNIVSVFDVEPKAPKFTVPIVSEELEIDLTQFNIWASIIRFFVLIGFIIALINITRKVIG